MKVSIEAAMEIWKAGGVAASEWQERSGYSRVGPIYRRRPTPVFCKEMERREVEHECLSAIANIAAYYKDVLDCVTKRFPKVRKLIVVNDPVGLAVACREAERPEPRYDRSRDRWDIGKTVASQKVWMAEAEKAAAPVLPWSALAKRLAPAPALGS